MGNICSVFWTEINPSTDEKTKAQINIFSYTKGKLSSSWGYQDKPEFVILWTRRQQISNILHLVHQSIVTFSQPKCQIKTLKNICPKCPASHTGVVITFENSFFFFVFFISCWTEHVYIENVLPYSCLYTTRVHMHLKRYLNIQNAAITSVTLLLRKDVDWSTSPR